MILLVVVFYIFILVIGYLLGSLNMSLLLSKYYGKDIRNFGSGNAGATNTLRTFGKKAAVISLVGDALKGIIACGIGYFITMLIFENENGLLIAGMGAIFGHIWPVFFKFKGGKGVLTTFSVILMMDWELALTLFAIFVIIVLISKIVSLGSVIVATAFPILAFIGIYNKKTDLFIITSIVLGSLVVYLHKDNIKRIVNGTEKKIGG
ncbi:MAG: glycerol-3-phosphate 1-O-acyltransferase PlsY [Clostridiales bacterium]